jgi:hypothetical protein
MPPKFDPNEEKTSEIFISLFCICMLAGNSRVFVFSRSTENCFFVCYLQLVSSLSVVFLRVVGGEVGATSSLAPKLGPLGLVSEVHYLVSSRVTPRTSKLTISKSQIVKQLLKGVRMSKTCSVSVGQLR